MTEIASISVKSIEFVKDIEPATTTTIGSGQDMAPVPKFDMVDTVVEQAIGSISKLVTGPDKDQ